MTKKNFAGFRWGRLAPPLYWMMTGPTSVLHQDWRLRVCHLIQGQVKIRSSLCSSANSPGSHRAALSAGSDPGDGDLWSTPPGFQLSGTS